MSSDLADIRALLESLPSELVDELLEEFEALRRPFLLRDWGPGELNGGRFGEVVLRLFEWMMDEEEKYTPLGTQLKRMEITNRVQTNSDLPDGVRFHVRLCTDLLLDVRNRRDVGHLGVPDLDVNRMDSELVLRLCSWVLAELIREYGGEDPDTAQQLVDKLSVEQVPWIEEVDGDLLVLATELQADDRTLLALHHAHPSSVAIPALRVQVGYNNPSRFKNAILGGLAKDRRIYVKNDAATITSKGIKQIEKKMVDLRTA